MKAALMNQNTLPFVAPPGPLANAPVASAYLGGMYSETGDPLWPNGRLWGYRRGFKNSGTDYINAGRPSSILTKIIPGTSLFTVCAGFIPRSSSANSAIVWLSNPDTSNRQIMIRWNNTTKKIDVCVGSATGVVSASSISTYAEGIAVSIIVSVGLSVSRLYVNGTQQAEFATTVSIATGNITFGVSPDIGNNGNWDGFNISFYEGYTSVPSCGGLTPIAIWKLEEPPLSPTVIDSIGGLSATVADGFPTGAIGAPMLVPIQWPA